MSLQSPEVSACGDCRVLVCPLAPIVQIMHEATAQRLPEEKEGSALSLQQVDFMRAFDLLAIGVRNHPEMAAHGHRLEGYLLKSDNLSLKHLGPYTREQVIGMVVACFVVGCQDLDEVGR